MKLVFHGGKCCGIKTIHSLGNSPTAILGEIAAKQIDNSDCYGHTVSSDKPFFHEAAPVETYLERLDRYIAYCDKRRPHGMIEITLAKNSYETPKQTEVWPPLLAERGFKLVNSCQNSNSGNRCFVFYRNSDVPGEEGKGFDDAEHTEVIDDEDEGVCDVCDETTDECSCDSDCF